MLVYFFLVLGDFFCCFHLALLSSTLCAANIDRTVSSVYNLFVGGWFQEIRTGRTRGGYLFRIRICTIVSVRRDES